LAGFACADTAIVKKQPKNSFWLDLYVPGEIEYLVERMQLLFATSASCIFLKKSVSHITGLQFSYNMDSCTFLEKGATHFQWKIVQVAPKTIKKYY
jgi:hypothetical protein